MEKFEFVIMISLTILTHAQNSNALQTMIATEYAFAKFANEHGTRAAFLEFIADDGILFRPGPTNGKKFLTDRKPTPGLLEWYPTIAVVSKACDLGFTTGPWQFRNNRDSAAIAFGNFCTVWQLQKDGTWKFAIDHGINYQKDELNLRPLTNQTISLTLTLNDDFKEAGSLDALFELDKKFVKDLEINLYKKYYEEIISHSSRVLRNNINPIVGTENILTFISQKEERIEFNPAGGKISLSNDLGFTYGSCELSEQGSKEFKKFYYSRFWIKENGTWKIFLEIVN